MDNLIKNESNELIEQIEFDNEVFFNNNRKYMIKKKLMI